MSSVVYRALSLYLEETSVLCQNCSSTAYAGAGGKQGKFVGLSWLCSLLANGAPLVNLLVQGKHVYLLGKTLRCTVCGRQRERNLGVTLS